jgi:hypothetical protein
MMKINKRMCLKTKIKKISKSNLSDYVRPTYSKIDGYYSDKILCKWQIIKTLLAL